MDFDTQTRARGYIRSRVTRVVSKITSETDLTPQEKAVYIEKLSSLKSDLDKANKDLFPLYIEASLTQKEIEAYMLEEETYDDKLLEALSILRHTVYGGLSSQVASGNQTSAASTGLKLPNVPLPEFSNSKNDDLQKFLTTFEFIISKHPLTSYEKFLHLKNQLSGSPRALIDSLDVQQQSYESARDLLKKALDC